MIASVWLVRSHQIAADLRYWLTYIGYDKRDHSLSHKIYLGYATLFFMIWGFATLALLSKTVAGILGTLSRMGLAYTAAGVLALALLGFLLYVAFRAGQRSPITFTEEDAALICQTPVSRPAVALLWMLGDWIKTGPAFWALSAAMAFALQDAALGATATVEHVPRYILACLQALSVALPLQWGVMALGWAWGALRLQRDRSPRFWWLPPAALAVVCVGLLVSSGSLIGGLYNGAGALLFAALIFSTSAGYGLSPWLAGVFVGLVWAGLGSLALGYAARHLNLGRAAQESTSRATAEAASLTGNAHLASEIALRERLGGGHVPTRLSPGPGWIMLAWKTALSWYRRGIMGLIGPLVVILVSGVGAALAPDLGTRAWAILAWLVAVGQVAAGPLQDDLRMWLLFRGLPFDPRRALLGELLLPCGLVTLFGWLALGIGGALPFGGLPLWAGVLVPGAALMVGLGAVVDVLRGARSGRLLTGIAPSPGTTGVLIGAVTAGLTALAVWFGEGGLLGYLMGAIVSGLLAYLLLMWADDALKNIE